MTGLSTRLRRLGSDPPRLSISLLEPELSGLLGLPLLGPRQIQLDLSDIGVDLSDTTGVVVGFRNPPLLGQDLKLPAGGLFRPNQALVFTAELLSFLQCCCASCLGAASTGSNTSKTFTEPLVPGTGTPRRLTYGQTLKDRTNVTFSLSNTF